MPDTGAPPGRLSCTLGKAASGPMDREAVKRRGWTESRILVVDERDHRLSDGERAFIRALGKRLYGG